MLFRLVRVRLRPYRRYLALVVILQLAQTTAALSLPMLNSQAVNSGVLRGDSAQVLRTGLLMLTVSVLQGACAVAAVHFSAHAAMALGHDLRGAVYARIQRLSALQIRDFSAASLITRSSNDVQQIQQLVLTVLTLMVVAPMMAVGSVVMALRLDAPLSLVLVFVLPALAISLGLIVHRMMPLSAGLQERIDRTNVLVREQITGIRVIRAFVRDAYEQRRFERANRDTRSVALRLGRTQALMMPAFTLIMECAGIVVVWFGGHRVAEGSLLPGTVIAFLHYLTQILQAVLMAVGAFMLMPRAAVCAGRVQEVLATSPRPVTPRQAAGAVRLSGHLTIENADFRYPGAQQAVLREVSLDARPGDTVAVVGSSGSGKSTLLNLVPRLYDPERGIVRLDGHDLRTLDQGTLAASIGLVVQKPYLFSGTLATNLRHGDPAASDEELWHALDVAQARDFVEATGEGLNAPVSQGGINFSGGQRQRIAIAQVLVRKPLVYLFDDSFSALDAVTQERLWAALHQETARATRVVVSQQAATIRAADRIIVLDEGRVTGSGTHAALMAENDAYREIVLSQSTEVRSVG
ncbi:ABC transporter ATP-binding protein [Streptomyces platensis]|uniref:ABC transporter ATP-binding protein n=1 Tax=Streptomyces platensis TaxID=58346 RepID=UPI00386AEE2B|nr:ABC transporter ATP-binding protein/permease [Streptomyces platensis]